MASSRFTCLQQRNNFGFLFKCGSQVCGSSYSGVSHLWQAAATTSQTATTEPAEIPKCRIHSSSQHTRSASVVAALWNFRWHSGVCRCLLPQLRCSTLPGTVPGPAYLPPLVMHPQIIPDKSKPVLNQKADIEIHWCIGDLVIWGHHFCTFHFDDFLVVSFLSDFVALYHSTFKLDTISIL